VKFFLVFSLWTGGPKARAMQAPDPKARATPAPDPWFGFDKLEHFAASTIIQSWAHTTLRAHGASYAQASWGAAAITASAGIGKEMWDRTHHGDFSYRDLAADGVGLLSGAVMMRQIDR
jgi:uncharacterized protein YfiM (DUF2279 family)